MKTLQTILALVLIASGGILLADEETAKKKPAKAKPITLADGKISLTPPSAWDVKKPRTRIVQYEFAAPVAKDDKIPGRVTVMGAGGSIDANVSRWMGQFVQPDGKSTKERTKMVKKKLKGGELHIIDISGTFLDKPGGPFTRTPSVKRENYRMMGAIIVTPKLGQYFVKLYGPKATIDSHAAGFEKMVKDAKIAE